MMVGQMESTSCSQEQSMVILLTKSKVVDTPGHSINDLIENGTLTFEPGEDWFGTVTYSTTAGNQPELLEYDIGAVVISNTIATRRVAYCNDGLFELQTTYKLYNNFPVYRCTSNTGLHMFRRKNGWVVTFGSQITENYQDGTSAHTKAPSIAPYGVDW